MTDLESTLLPPAPPAPPEFRYQEAIGAYMRLALGAGLAVYCIFLREDVPALWMILTGYSLGAAVEAWFVSRGRISQLWLRVMVVLDTVLIGVLVYGFGSSNGLVAVFYFPLVAAYVFRRGPSMGLFVFCASLISFITIVSLESLGLVQWAPLLNDAPPVYRGFRDGLTSIIVFVTGLASMYVFLLLLIRRIDRHKDEIERTLEAEFVARKRAGELKVRLGDTQRLEALGKLAGGIAHDFNNQLTGILGYAGCVKDEADDPDLVRNDIEEVIQISHQAREMTAQLLAFSRRQAIDRKVFDLTKMVASQEDLLRRMIGEEVHIELDLPAGRCPVYSDRNQLERILVNLAINARDAMPGGGVLLIRLEPVVRGPDGAAVKLSVQDDGVGMDPETLGHIFEPFFTTKGRGKGTGLGLSMVYGTVKQLGGEILVDSTPGEGTVFQLYLPTADAEIEESSENLPSVLGGTETILLAEDELSVRDLAIRLLTRRGYKVLAAASGEEAIELAAQHDGPIDLLLTDVVMPGISGRELADRLALSRPETPVLFMSGYTGEVILKHGLQEEDTLLLQKPYDAEMLLKGVRSALAGAGSTEP